MRHQKKTIKLGRSTAARKALMNNLSAQLVLYEAIQTTEAKAKALRTVIEPMITKAKTGKLAARRQLLGVLPMPTAVKKLFEVIGPRYKDRAGGYTRITPVKVRVGDGAKICKIELV